MRQHTSFGSTHYPYLALLGRSSTSVSTTRAANSLLKLLQVVLHATTHTADDKHRESGYGWTRASTHRRLLQHAFHIRHQRVAVPLNGLLAQCERLHPSVVFLKATPTRDMGHQPRDITHQPRQQGQRDSQTCTTGLEKSTLLNCKSIADTTASAASRASTSAGAAAPPPAAAASNAQACKSANAPHHPQTCLPTTQAAVSTD